jgi:hypothetical protein|uniref:Uncharacterized protein n=1 Tax=Sipha flava TaxID=143950 RepID=A0A2S2Q1F0_9HEMI
MFLKVLIFLVFDFSAARFVDFRSNLYIFVFIFLNLLLEMIILSIQECALSINILSRLSPKYLLLSKVGIGILFIKPCRHYYSLDVKIVWNDSELFILTQFIIPVNYSI